VAVKRALIDAEDEFIDVTEAFPVGVTLCDPVADKVCCGDCDVEVEALSVLSEVLVESADVVRCALRVYEGLVLEDNVARGDAVGKAEREVVPQRDAEPETLGDGDKESDFKAVDEAETDNDTREEAVMLDVTVEHILTVWVSRVDDVPEAEGRGERLDDGEPEYCAVVETEARDERVFAGV